MFNNSFIAHNNNFFQKKIVIIIFYILFIIIFNIIYFRKLRTINNIKVCLCTIGKNENNYVKEFIEHYKNYGIDKIVIYDNNDIDGERFEELLNNYIKNNFVEILDYRGKEKIQLNSINDCYKNNFLNYNWLLFYDMDEFINLKERNIKFFLAKKKFNSCERIYLNWVNHLDNDQLNYKNQSLFKRFPKFKYFFNKTKALVKSMIRGNIPNIRIYNNHVINFEKESCNAFGVKKLFNQSNTIENPDNKNYYIDHFYFKSAEEYINKRNRGSVFYGNKSRISLYFIDLYFKYNRITKEKINYFEKKTIFNLSKYKNFLN